jgi:hypothetical protein
MTPTFNNNSEVLDGELKSLCENNSNTGFTEKNMKDKIIDMPKVSDNRLLIGAGMMFGRSSRKSSFSLILFKNMAILVSDWLKL